MLLPVLALAADTPTAAELLAKSGTLPGPFVVHLHCGDGTQTAELLKRDGLVVQGLDTSRATVEAARRNPAFRKDYGNRITFTWFDGRNLPFIDNCVNVVVLSGVPPSPEGSGAASGCQVSGEEIQRVLAPRGVLLTRSPLNTEHRTLNTYQNPAPEGWHAHRKAVPPEIDDWSHHMYGPDNNRVSRDTRLAPPLSHMQWTVGPRFTRHHEHMSSFQAMVSARGKIFYIIDEGPKDSVLLPPDWSLVARDAFNGIELWRKPLARWFDHLWTFKSGPVVVTRRLVAQEDRLFAALAMGGPVSILDANSGAALHELPGTDGTEEIIVDGNRLILVKREWLSKGAFPGHSGSRHKLNPFAWRLKGGAQSVMVLDVDTRKLLWERATPVAPLGLGARNGQVYVFDGQRVLSLEADSGKETWTSPELCRKNAYTPNNGSSLVCGETRILVGSITGHAAQNSTMIALSAEDGSIVWKAPQYASGRHSPKDLFLIDGKAWSANTLPASMTLPGVPSTARRKSGRITGYNLDDGEAVADFHTDSDVYIMNSRCHMSCATANYFVTSRTGVELVSIENKQWNLHHWVRGACLYGVMPANGILYAPPNPCGCYTQSSLDGFNALTGRNAGWQGTVDRQKTQGFVRGPAWSAPGTPEPAAAEPQSWPAYRHDNQRSGSTPVDIELGLGVRWRTEGYENLTAPVVARQRCIVAEKDRHTLHCLNASDGKPQWAYVAGGRIDSPPAVSGDSLFFGCGDGWLYRLLVSTGELVWKRRIAPADLLLFDHGQPASVWPLSGSVLVQDGKVTCVAGRSSFLDGGMRVTLVDAATGDILNENVMDHLDPDTRQDMHQHVAMQNLPVSLPDILSSDGKHLYMRTQQLDLTGKRTHVKNAGWDDDIEIGIGREHLFAATGFLDDNWFHRSYWVYGNSFLEGCSMPSGGWFEMSRISPSGKMLCFDDTTVYGYGQFPEYSKWSTPLRYSAFSMNKKPKSYKPGTPDEELRKIKPNWRKYRTLRVPKVEFDLNWKNAVPLRAKAIVKTPDTLFLAGPEDVLDEMEFFRDPRAEPNEVLAHKQKELIAARKGGKILAVSVQDGSVEQEIDLESQPVWDGMAVAYGNLFMCCRDGSVVAFKGGHAVGEPVPNLEPRPAPEATHALPFVEEFTGLSGGGAALQPGTRRPLKHSATLPRWDVQGFNAIHAVQRADSTWATQVFASPEGDNTLTLRTGLPANEKGRAYIARLQAGPTVYGDPGKATRNDDRFTIELLRPDDSVLKKHVVTPGAWSGKEAFAQHEFSYQGDGSGDLRIRIAPVPTEKARFTGAISHIRILGTARGE